MVGHVYYNRGDKEHIPLAIIIPAVIVPMLLFIVVSVYCYRFEEERGKTGSRMKVTHLRV